MSQPDWVRPLIGEPPLTGYGPFWGRNGVLFEKADATTIGPSEGLPAIKQRGYGYVLFDPLTGDWQAERMICERISLDYGVWTRVQSQAALEALLRARHEWPGCKAIAPNNEIGNGDQRGDTRDPILMHSTLFTMSQAGVALEITDGWADPIGCWAGFRRWVGAVECFPEQDRALADIAGCVMHAGAFFRRVVACLGSYGTGWKGRKPVLGDYSVPAGIPYLVFLGDTVDDWSHW